MSPQQEIFTAVRQGLVAAGGDVYDTILPPAETPYPFYYVGNTRQTDDPLTYKNALVASVYQDIHIWHNEPRNRGTVSQMMQVVRGVCYGLETTASYKWQLISFEEQLLEDTTTKTPLLHGVATVGFRLLGGTQ